LPLLIFFQSTLVLNIFADSIVAHYKNRQANRMSFFLPFRSEHAKKYIKNSGWMVGDFLLRTGINVLVGIFIARYLQPGNFGVISYASSFVQLLVPLSLLGLNAIVIKELVYGQEKSNEIIGTAFYLKIAASVVSLLVLAGIVFFTENDASTRNYILIIGLSFLFSPFQVIDFYFQSKVLSKYSVISQQISTAICALLKIYCIYTKKELLYFVCIALLEAVLPIIAMVIMYRKQGNRISLWEFNQARAISMTKESLPLILTGFFIIFYMKIDQIMIKNMMNNFATGNFSAAVKLSESFYMIPGILVVSLFPAIINGKKMGEEEYRKRLQKLYDLLSLIAITVSICVFLCSDYIILILYGNDFIGSSAVLKLHFWNSLFVFWGVIYSQAFIVEGMQKVTLYNTIVGAILNVVLNLVLIPRIGIVGSALATILAQLYSGCLSLLLFPQARYHFGMMMKSLNIVRTLRLYLLKFTSAKPQQ
jgi:O-antigen/teichoic acid export membrane protein